MHIQMMIPLNKIVWPRFMILKMCKGENMLVKLKQAWLLEAKHYKWR